MIGIDTNVLLRAFLDDDSAQSPLARAELNARERNGEPIFVRDVVLAEFVWVLGSIYSYTRTQTHAALRSVLGTTGLSFEDEKAAEEAISRAERDRVDFADALIAIRNRRDGCASTLSFDQRASRMAEVTLLRA